MTRSAASFDAHFGKFLGAILSLATWREETLISQSRLWMTDAIDVEFCNAKKQRPTLPITSRGMPRVFRFGLSLACTHRTGVVYTNLHARHLSSDERAQINASPTLVVRIHHISSQFSRHLVPFLLGTYLDHMTSWKSVVSSSCRRAVVNIGRGWMDALIAFCNFFLLARPGWFCASLSPTI